MKKMITVVNSVGVPFNVEKDGNIIKFYDARFKTEFEKLGKFISGYYIRTIERYEGSIHLDNLIDDWFVTPENVEYIQQELIK